MQIPIINGIYTDTSADFRAAYPTNMKPIIQRTGVSEGFLRPVEGIVQNGLGPGVSRGAINYGGEHYRVMGDKLCKIDEGGIVYTLGTIEDDGKPVKMTYSFDRLAIASAERLYYFQNGTLEEVTDINLGAVVDVIWVDGYFMTTDGVYLVVTELNDPTTVDPDKYGSSEIDPDPVVGLVKLRNEVYAINRYTIEVFNNIGGDNFPFSRVTGAQIQKGALGPRCAIAYEGRIAFLGSAPGESPGVFLGASGTAQRVSTRTIDELLSNYTEDELSEVVLEVVNDRSHALLWVRLPDRTLVYDLQSSSITGESVWYTMSSSMMERPEAYRGVDVIWCYNGWQVGDAQSNAVGYLTDDVSTHFGDQVYWDFSTRIVYNEAKGAQFHSLELIGLPGRTAFEEDAYISTCYSVDGRNWSQQRPLFVGLRGNRTKRMVWRRQGHMRNMRIQRFVGDSRAYLAVARLEAEVEGLNA